MAGQVKFCFAFLLVFHVSLVSCRPDYHQYFSQYIKDESTTESSLSSTGISTGKSENISNPEVPYSENLISPKANSYSSSNNNVYEKPVQSAYSGFNDIVVIWGFKLPWIIALVVIICCLTLCCSCCCKRKKRRECTINISIPEQPTANLVQPLIPQAVAMQHVPPETQILQLPPAYDTQPIQQQFLYPPQHFLQQYPMQPMNQQQYPMQPMGQQQYSMQPMGQQQNLIQPMGQQQIPIQPLVQQQHQEALIPYGYSSPEATSPSYSTKN